MKHAKNLPPLDMLHQLLAYDPHSGLLVWKKARGTKAAGCVAGSLDRAGYIRLGIDGQLYAAHRIAWAMHYGEPAPSDLDIDHINLSRADNRIGNLRIATRSQNKINSPARADCTSGIKGVRYRRNKWEARIFVRGKFVSLGQFEERADAVDAYRVRAIAEFGEFARFDEE